MIDLILIQAIAIKVLKAIVLVTGFMDSYKYKLQAQKVCKLKSSGQISRLALLYAIMHRVPLMLYVSLVLKDTILIIISFIALYTITEALYYTYIYYPYRNRGLKNFKRPSFYKFVKHTIEPYKHGKRL